MTGIKRVAGLRNFLPRSVLEGLELNSGMISDRVPLHDPGEQRGVVS